MGLLSLHVGDRRIAEELAHDALVRTQEQWERVRHMDAPGAWLRRVGLNLANSWWRRRFAERRANRLATAGAATDAPADVADALAVRTAVAALPRRQRSAITLRYFVGLSVAEAASEMGCAEGTVKSLSSQALAALRTTFTDLDAAHAAHDTDDLEEVERHG
ncbi:MAG: sigma-70 family RNA polymerase sigma factor [Acidimicrobiales bacterium]|nr:sigma-70 family RNA polymerase sigma factor [Acidimicrobiales bacterium]